MENDILKSYVSELSNGSYKAFSALYEIYADKLFRFVLAHTKSRDLAKDIVQETFLKLWIIRHSVTENGSFQSLLFTISKNKMIDVYRSQINQIKFEDYINYCNSDIFAENDIERKINYDEFLQALKISKKLLPERQLEIFELSREKGLNVIEIATSLGISEQTVKNQITSALKTLRKELSKYNQLFVVYFAYMFYNMIM